MFVSRRRRRKRATEVHRGGTRLRWKRGDQPAPLLYGKRAKPKEGARRSVFVDSTNLENRTCPTWKRPSFANYKGIGRDRRGRGTRQETGDRREKSEASIDSLDARAWFQITRIESVAFGMPGSRLIHRASLLLCDIYKTPERRGLPAIAPIRHRL